MGLSLEDSEDVVQEALLRLHVYLKTRTVSNEEGFLRRTVHNLVVDQFRRSRPDRRRDIAMEDVVDTLVSDIPGPERILVAEEALYELEGAVTRKSAGAGQILVALEAGYTHADIARAMRVSSITVKRRLAKARSLVADIKAHGLP